MVKARLSEAEWDKIKQSSGIVENGSEAGRPQSDVVEPMAMPSRNPTKLGNMGEAKGGKMVGKMTEWESHAGYDASTNEFEKNHPTLAKAVDIGKRVVGKVGEFVEEEMIHHGAEERKKPTEEEKKEQKKKTQKEEEEEEKKKKQKKLSSIEKKLKKGFLDDEDDEYDDDKKSKTSKKSQILSRGYESAYGGEGGLSGKRGYESAYKSTMGGGGYEAAYKSTMGMGSYQPAYKQRDQPHVAELATPNKVKSAVEEIPTTPQPAQRQPDRFNMQNWQSMGFPNTLPQSARGSLFRPAPQQQPVTPMVRQPYQPRAVPVPQPVRAQTPTPQPQARRQVFGPIPRIGLNINIPQMTRPKTTVAPPRAPTAPTHMGRGIPTSAPLTFMGVTLGEKKKQEPNKPITRMGEGYKHVPMVVMNGIYPNAGYNPNTDSITKKSIIPKIRATISPNDFTMFGMKLKNRKI